jgi:mannose-6-phosphate isomerase-like protein (cupin superfamily)
MPLSPIHRVVTGHDLAGKAVIVSDGSLPTVRALEAVPGMVFHEVWETRNTPALVDNGQDPTLSAMMHEAPRNGTRIRFVDFPPDASYLAEPNDRIQALFREINNEQGMTTKPDSPHAMMHRTESIDYGVVMEGEITLVLDDSEVRLEPGSVVVQRGTNHAWANRTNKPSRMLFVQLDGKYEPAIAAALALR